MAEAHYLSMVVMGVGTFVFGMLPLAFSSQCKRSCPVILSLILCLGAGVLLATSLVHMLSEVQVKLQWSAQLYFCGGFLILYIIDEITHYCIRSKTSRHVTATTSVGRNSVNSEKNDYGATHNTDPPSEGSVLFEGNNAITTFQNHCDAKCDNCQNSQLRFRQAENSSLSNSQQNLLGNSLHSSDYHQEPSPHDVEISEPHSSSSVAKAGLLVALLIHSVLEGITIGVQTESSQVLLILGAVVIHKVVLSFCLGLELNSHGYTLVNLVTAISLFSLGSPIGILIGITVTSPGKNFHIDHQLQAMAAGSLLYVAAFEVLPRERYKWHHRNNERAIGIFQVIFLLLGFLCITLLHLTIKAEPGNNNATTPIPITPHTNA